MWMIESHKGRGYRDGQTNRLYGIPKEKDALA